jgi:hydroxymethylpyrimidine/phosphomethylpyrimidine kinase
LKNIDLITHHHEIIQLSPAETNAENTQNAISILCYFTKGGHHPEKIGIDTLYTKERSSVLPKKSSLTENMVQAVLSSAIVSNLALGNDLRTACYLAKDYIETYLQSPN